MQLQRPRLMALGSLKQPIETGVTIQPAELLNGDSGGNVGLKEISKGRKRAPREKQSRMTVFLEMPLNVLGEVCLLIFVRPWLAELTILGQIMSYLVPLDILRLSRVSKDFR